MGSGQSAPAGANVKSASRTNASKTQCPPCPPCTSNVSASAVSYNKNEIDAANVAMNTVKKSVEIAKQEMELGNKIIEKVEINITSVDILTRSKEIQTSIFALENKPTEIHDSNATLNKKKKNAGIFLEEVDKISADATAAKSTIPRITNMMRTSESDITFRLPYLQRALETLKSALDKLKNPITINKSKLNNATKNTLHTSMKDVEYVILQISQQIDELEKLKPKIKNILKEINDANIILDKVINLTGKYKDWVAKFTTYKIMEDTSKGGRRKRKHKMDRKRTHRKRR